MSLLADLCELPLVSSLIVDLFIKLFDHKLRVMSVLPNQGCFVAIVININDLIKYYLYKLSKYTFLMFIFKPLIYLNKVYLIILHVTVSF